MANGVATGTACRGCWPRLGGGRACALPSWLSHMLEAESALMLVQQLPPLAVGPAAADDCTGVTPVTSGRVTSASPAVQRWALDRLPLLPLCAKKVAASDSVCFRLRRRAVRFSGDVRSLCALP